MAMAPMTKERLRERKPRAKEQKAYGFSAFPLIVATGPSVVIQPSDGKANQTNKKLKGKVGGDKKELGNEKHLIDSYIVK